jgi:glycosyl hydrolase family 115 (putative glucuronidase)/glycosyl hydrolase family 115
MRMKRILLAFVLVTGKLFAAECPAVNGVAQSTNDFALVQFGRAATIFYDDTDAKVVSTVAGLFAADIQRVSGVLPVVTNYFTGSDNRIVLIGTIGHSASLDRLVASGKINVKAIQGGWERYQIEVVENPLPGVTRALVIAGSDRRGAAYGALSLSAAMGVSPWYWWADVPPRLLPQIFVSAEKFVSEEPAVRYRGIFLNDEDWGLRPWAAKTFEPETGNIGPKTYTKIFELLLRLRANYLWPAMHPGTAPFNSFATNREIADVYAIVMGASHCEQMLRNNVGEWDEKVFGEYNFVTNPDGVLKYWEQRVRENGKFENVYTLGMRGIHDGAMPGGGTDREKAARLHTIIGDQREMLGRLVNINLAQVPQIFCPYKEVLPLYRLAPDIPEDITLVWPDDNFGYIRQFSDARERARSGGAGVYYHVSYYGRPNDYLWLCTTPPALIAEEMTKAYDYGANRVWILNVGDLKPAEYDMEFFLNLAWNPHAWDGQNTYDFLEKQIARDIGPQYASFIAAFMTSYYTLNFQRKPEHMMSTNLFTPSEALERVQSWRLLAHYVDNVETNLPPNARDAFFELIGYPVKAAAAMHEKYLASSQTAADEIHRLTDRYNNQIAGGKWRYMMSDNPRGQLDSGVPKVPVIDTNAARLEQEKWAFPNRSNLTNFPGADFVERNHWIIMEAENASTFVSGKDAKWRKIFGLGYNNESVDTFPVTVPVRSDPEKIIAESPCLQFKMGLQSPGDWRITVRALPTFSVDTGKPQRYAIAIDDQPMQIISLPLSQDERNHTWGENVLRNAALTTSRHTIAKPGVHTLKIWMVDPGIVLDTVAAENGSTEKLGYVWPDETRAN